uniref:Ig-like domain-containing protein n=1 Tax=Cyprinus carpio TaxID=7962 RepID=A0A8C1GJS2_CYPCA
IDFLILISLLVLSTNFTARPGDNITIWCQHTSEIGKNIHWFKQSNSDVPLSIVYMMLPFELEVKATYLNGFQPDRLVMSLNRKNTSLRISNVDISDSGLYYCGWQNWVMTFGDGTHLDIKERSVTPLQNQTEITNKDLKKSPISTSDCSENIFYKLTFIFGGIIVILIIILLTTLIIKIQDRNKHGKDVDRHETQPHEEPHSSVYAALQFSKHKSRRAARNTEYTDVVYSATR